LRIAAAVFYKSLEMDREQIFAYLKAEDFNNVIQFLKSSKQLAEEDAIVQQGITHFFSRLLTRSETKQSEKLYIFQQLYILHTKSFFHFNSDQFETILRQVCELAATSEERYYYAKQHPELPFCKDIIDKFQADQPQILDHHQSDLINVALVHEHRTNLATSIFNSIQERLFYFALRNCYPTYLIYPNVTLSTFLKFDAISGLLTDRQRKFFYSTTVDFVVVDQFDDFKPSIAIELDSEWHRLNNQNAKDEMKNIIFKSAGIPLYRIEHVGRAKSIEEFEKVIIETVRKVS
jgi:hypothetical protein